MTSGRLARSLRIAVDGLQRAWREQPNLRLEAGAALLAISAALLLAAPLVPILLCCGLVLTSEVLNSAVETVVDLASPEDHALARRAKDVAAGGVLLSALTAALVGLVVLGPPLVAQLGRWFAG